MTVKLTARTADQVRAFSGIPQVSTTKSTITFDMSKDLAEKVVEDRYGAARGDKGKRIAIASVRRALAKAVEVEAAEAPKVEEAPKKKGAAKSKKSTSPKVLDEAPAAEPFAAPDGFFVVDLPTPKVVQAVETMLARQEVGREVAHVETDVRLLLCSRDVNRAASLVSTITAHMSAIVKEDRSANMYAEGKLRGVRTAILAAVPGSEAGLPQRKSATAKGEDKLRRVEALNERLRADRERREAAKAAKAAKTA